MKKGGYFQRKDNVEFIKIISARKASKQENQHIKWVSPMKDEYDFTNAEQGKFYRPIEDLDIPIYLDKEVKEFFIGKIKNRSKSFSLNEVINSLIKKDIEISNKLVLESLTKR